MLLAIFPPFADTDTLVRHYRVAQNALIASSNGNNSAAVTSYENSELHRSSFVIFSGTFQLHCNFCYCHKISSVVCDASVL